MILHPRFTHPIAILLAGLLIAVAIAISNRYEMVAVPGAAILHDSWTGNVEVCATGDYWDAFISNKTYLAKAVGYTDAEIAKFMKEHPEYSSHYARCL
jgi:hypothetical protein